MVKWQVTTDRDIVIEGATDDGSWRLLGKNLSENNLKINKLSISNEYGTASTDSNKMGYLVGNKVVAALSGGQQLEMVGIGYLDKIVDVVRIVWYNSKTLEPITTEAREIEDCGFFLIINP